MNRKWFERYSLNWIKKSRANKQGRRETQKSDLISNGHPIVAEIVTSSKNLNVVS